jgi:Holliday junction DNA helicase RuvA
MISRICGKIKKYKDNSLLIEINGICYEVLIPSCVMQSINDIKMDDGTVELVTFHYYHTEPARSFPILIGFANEVEREFFEQFITVSGIGPKAAVRALSLPISRIAQAIDRGDFSLLQTLPGIGAQRAKEIIAKLQGKVGKFGLIKDRGVQTQILTPADVESEAMEVLLQLQYKKQEAKNMIRRAIEANPEIRSAEELLNEVYKQRLG